MFKVMIVEDEPIERECLEAIIANMSEDVEVVCSVGNGDDAIEFTKNNYVDLIFMDINMPGKNGIRACEEIRKIQKNTKLVIVTAYDEFEFARRGIQLSVCDYLLKPIRPAKIVSLIRNILESEEQSKSPSNLLEKYFDNINKHIASRSYLSTVKEVKSFTSFVYEKSDFKMHEVNELVSRLAIHLLSISKSYEGKYLSNQKSLCQKLENRCFDYNNKYSADLDLVEMVNIIFKSLLVDKISGEYGFNRTLTYL